MSALYTALAILGWLTFCALIAWFVGSFVDFAAQLFDDEDGKVADAWGDVPALHEEMRPARAFKRGGIVAAELSERADTHNTHSVLLSGPLSGTGTL
jgi:hypothetical protein